MRASTLALDSRLRPLAAGAETLRRSELATLVLIGAVAAVLASTMDLGLRIPGHRILYTIFPMAFGFSLVPRRGAGTVMGVSAVTTTGLFALVGARVPGAGGLTSLALTGPLLDIALRRRGRGWRLYAAFVLAGVMSNVAVFLVRGAAKALAVPGLAGSRPFDEWLSVAVFTYAIAGFLAGLISAATWFELRGCTDDGDEGSGLGTGRGAPVR